MKLVHEQIRYQIFRKICNRVYGQVYNQLSREVSNRLYEQVRGGEISYQTKHNILL